MKARIIAALLVAGLGARHGSAQALASQRISVPEAPGVWKGEARLSGKSFEVFFEIAADGLATRLTVPDAGVWKADAGSAALRGGAIEIEVRVFGGRYRGVFSEDGAAIRGSFEAPNRTIPLDLARVAAIPLGPGEPRRPYPYREEEVAFVNARAGITFHGTLTIPPGPGPHPAAVMITGAGCQNRDEAIGPPGSGSGLRPFLVIADYLSCRGVAVLRCDDRGFGETKGDVLDSTSEDFADDVLAGLESLAKRPEIDPGRIGLIGHSEGGMVAMIAASKSPRIAFVVSIAGVAQDCKELAWSTLERMVQPDRMIQPARTVTKLAMRRALTLLQSDASDAQVAKEFGSLLPADVVPRVVCRWTRFMARYDPGPAIEKVNCPILGLFAGKDLLVPAKENSEGLRDSAEIGGNEDVTIVTYPAFDHFFLAIPIGAAATRPAQAVLAPEVLDQIGRWVAEKAKPRAASRSESR